MDKKDKDILAILQEDATQPVNAVAERVNLSMTACWKRIQRLTDEGVIRKQVCLLDPRKLGLGIVVFVSIKTSHHDAQWLQKFSKGVQEIPEVVEFYRMSGDIDYLLKVLVSDISGYDLVYKKLIRIAELFDVSSSFAMEELKCTTAVPLDKA
ncbi:Lrp/AsnC family transcriptional regulator [Verminephrobacter aporrectodeae]|uniref:Lrp/AsnC family transcriptional regulator n=1 Tax=Verminephrobacter aporrectodeae subsp. tuberculatae TaxID=1110392 RepID=A0ABT3KUX4_9BURK|nr:Lrp/AsnC family transcriptional regulator [Verminephrobacter aporrectodeae]MCW5223088.1 Lrp/AsnC family transcriptional regulator [Verminephrobacter aporrectodeae subsp. tuberculatae]MCW5256693.1 Lrp/AsnC family transcriptional regulator [Verminephrobacter aporrectodeae subsp. tuberculatae]MCW5288552.1 Lrp/AsnC family transcriptional regulator [Verminephrobacter aporrectodeae subsp. tuberculatae]MCW5322140.1 Lrp/AsnC family transcriptional regulator [Verminephrobacter aporrectodeae subsp. tu